MSEYEWVQRARMQFARRTGDFEYDWIDEATICFECDRDDFKGYNADDPEYAVDEEISCWD